MVKGSKHDVTKTVLLCYIAKKKNDMYLKITQYYCFFSIFLDKFAIRCGTPEGAFLLRFLSE